MRRAVAGVAWLARPAPTSLGNLNLLVFVVGLVGLCVVLGMPIGFAFGMATLAYLAPPAGAPLRRA